MMAPAVTSSDMSFMPRLPVTVSQSGPLVTISEVEPGTLNPLFSLFRHSSNLLSGASRPRLT
jgi:hypothetical protein